jgi:hypothetical protein
VTFNVVANSVQNAVNADVSFAIDAYGLSPIEYNLDLCSVANGVLCPLPAYSFNGQASYFIPPNYISQIPSIAYSIPDLEASATVRIVDTSTDQEVACLTVFLSNGKTTRHAYVSWIVGAFIILATLVALIHPYYPLAKSRSAPDYRLLGMVNWAQFMALTGMISVHYPQALVSFAQNFAWTCSCLRMPGSTADQFCRGSDIHRTIPKERRSHGDEDGRQLERHQERYRDWRLAPHRPPIGERRSADSSG